MVLHRRGFGSGRNLFHLRGFGVFRRGGVWAGAVGGRELRGGAAGGHGLRRLRLVVNACVLQRSGVGADVSPPAGGAAGADAPPGEDGRREESASTGTHVRPVFLVVVQLDVGGGSVGVG